MQDQESSQKTEVIKAIATSSASNVDKAIIAASLVFEDKSELIQAVIASSMAYVVRNVESHPSGSPQLDSALAEARHYAKNTARKMASLGVIYDGSENNNLLHHYMLFGGVIAGFIPCRGVDPNDDAPLLMGCIFNEWAKVCSDACPAYFSEADRGWRDMPGISPDQEQFSRMPSGLTSDVLAFQDEESCWNWDAGCANREMLCVFTDEIWRSILPCVQRHNKDNSAAPFLLIASHHLARAEKSSSIHVSGTTNIGGCDHWSTETVVALINRAFSTPGIYAQNIESSVVQCGIRHADMGEQTVKKAIIERLSKGSNESGEIDLLAKKVTHKTCTPEEITEILSSLDKNNNANKNTLAYLNEERALAMVDSNLPESGFVTPANF